MKKFRLPSLWLVERTDHHARLSGDQDGQIVSNYADNAAEVGRPGASDTVKSQCSNFKLYPLRHWQPMEDVAKNRCDVLVFTKTNNKTSGGVEHHL